ncbi:MAG: hypothetical protein ACTSSG_11945 [Candidatus Heimdallarchaeaceae archaeon]
MPLDVVEIGFKPLSEDELEELAEAVEDELIARLENKPLKRLLKDFSIIVSLDQSPNKTLTLSLDFEITAELSEQQFDNLNEELRNIAQKILKEELECRKSS